MIVENPNRRAGLPRRIAIFNGAMELGTERPELRADPDRRIESWLLDTAMATGVISEAVVRRAKGAAGCADAPPIRPDPARCPSPSLGTGGT